MHGGNGLFDRESAAVIPISFVLSMLSYKQAKVKRGSRCPARRLLGTPGHRPRTARGRPPRCRRARAGVATAFASPIGGLLFTIEEGASFYSTSIFWRGFLSTGIGVLTLHFLVECAVRAPCRGRCRRCSRECSGLAEAALQPSWLGAGACA